MAFLCRAVGKDVEKEGERVEAVEPPKLVRAGVGSSGSFVFRLEECPCAGGFGHSPRMSWRGSTVT